MCECECVILWLDNVDALMVFVSLLGVLQLSFGTCRYDFSGLFATGLI